MAPSQGFGAGGGGASRGAAQRQERQLEQRAQRSLEAGDWEGAERAYRLLVQRQSTNPAVYTNLAALLSLQRRPDDLEPLLRQALALRPDDPVVHNNLGQVLVQRGALQPAEACFAAAVALDPAYPQALTNLANLRSQGGALQEAIALYERALAADPSHAEAHWNLAHPLLLQGDYRRGLRQYEYRTAIAEPIRPHAVPPLPLWDGSPLPAQDPLVLVSEQGLGDSLQFMRLAPLLRQRQGCSVLLSVQEKLAPLAERAGLADRVVPHAELPGLRRGRWLPLLSLPGRLGIEPTQPLPPLPPLQPSAEARQRWAAVLAAADDPGPIRVGLHWQGDPAHETTSLRGRSLPLELLAPLAAIPQLTLVSLQRGPGMEQVASCGFRDRFSRAQAAMDDAWAFDDMAAMAEQCHLVISADSAMVHLAAGLGRPTWVLLKAIPEWRWGLEGSGSFWYPSVRLWRQARAGDWAGLIQAVAANLEAQIRSGAIPPMLISIPVSLGELVDKITILQIKARHLQGDALGHVQRELQLLEAALAATGVALDPALEAQLLEVNGQLWEIEDAIREQERQRRFEQAFIELARSVYRTNDRRADLKRQINQRYGSTLIEQKSYSAY